MLRTCLRSTFRPQLNYSDRKDFTGSASAARMLWNDTVTKAIPSVSAATAANTHQEIWMWYS